MTNDERKNFWDTICSLPGRDIRAEREELLKAIKFPKYLYRYRPVNTNNLEALRTNRLYFSSANYYDDPFDTFLHIDIEELKKEYLSILQLDENTENKITDIVKNSSTATIENDKKLLEAYLQSIDAQEDTIKKYLGNLNWDKNELNEFIQKLVKKSKTSTTKVNETIGGDGTPKPTFYSHVDDYRAFFYNWLLDTDNKQFKQLFFGITGLTAMSYGGKLAGEAIKEVQVKKLNAKTEVELQNRLVSTELRNFKSKKDAAIQPLVDEFYKQVDKGKPKEELKVMADNILFEIKNGPPFVYS